MARYYDSKERGNQQLAEYHILDSLCDTACLSSSTNFSFTASQAQEIQCTSSSKEGTRFTQWKIESAFEEGLSQLVRTAKSTWLKDAVALTVHIYLGRNYEAVEGQLPFPSGKAILAVLGSAESVFRHDLSFGSQRTLQLTIQCYSAIDSLLKDLLRDGQRIDMTGYISATLRYYEQHGSPHRDMGRRAALVKGSFPQIITPSDGYAPFILIGNDERGSYRIGTNTSMFQEELAGVEKFGSPYYRLRAQFLSTELSTEKGEDRNFDLLRERLEEAPLFHAGVVVAVGKSCSDFS